MTSRRDSGETLLEVLISIAILGILSAAMFAGITSTIVAGDSHRRLSDVEVVARSYGEAVVNKAVHPTTTTLTIAAMAGDSSITVLINAGMTASTSISLDGEVAKVSSTTGSTKVSLASALTSNHPIASSVTRYEPCPQPADLTVAGFTTGSAQVSTPVVTVVEYLAPPASVGIPPVPLSAAGCSTFWTVTGKPCSSYDAPPHYTQCDPPLLRVTISVSSTDVADKAHGASTITRVLINRGNA